MVLHQKSALTTLYDILCQQDIFRSIDMQLNLTKVTHSFNRHAKSYPQAAALQAEVAQRLVERLELILIEPKTILDLGCGSGFCTQQLQQRYKKANFIGLDIAMNMLQQLRQGSTVDNYQPQLVCADAVKLPFADHSLDLIVSSLALHWCSDFTNVWAELMRVLRPGGLLLFSVCGPDTLQELRESWANIDDAAHVHSFFDMHDIGDVLLQCGYSDPVMDMEKITVTYPDIWQMLRELRASGVSNSLSERRRSLTGKATFANLQKSYEYYRLDDGTLPLSYEIIYGHAWAPQTEVAIPVSSIKRL